MTPQFPVFLLCFLIPLSESWEKTLWQLRKAKYRSGLFYCHRVQPSKLWVAFPVLRIKITPKVIRIRVLPYRATSADFSFSVELSFVKHLLGGLFEFATSFNIKLLVFLGYRCCGSTISSILSNNINGLVVIGDVAINLISMSLFCTGVSYLVLELLIVHLLQTRCILSIWSNLRVLTTSNRQYIFFIWWLSLFTNNVKHRVFECLFVFAESVLLPRVVHYLGIILVTAHTVHENCDTGSVIRLLLKLKWTTILHKLFEFMGMATT